VEEEQKFTDEGIRSYLRGRRSTSSSALLGALEEQDTLEGQLASLPGRGRTSTAALQSHLQDTRDEMGRLTTLADMHKELGAVQQHLAELRAELGIVPEEPHSSAADNLAPDGPVPTASAVDALRCGLWVLAAPLQCSRMPRVTCLPIKSDREPAPCLSPPATQTRRGGRTWSTWATYLGHGRRRNWRDGQHAAG
jgi:hypothetical protein